MLYLGKYHRKKIGKLMKKFLSIAEASELTGKHPDTIRALIKKHPEAVKKEGNKYLIKAEILARFYALNEENSEAEKQGGNYEKLMNEFLTAQREEIASLRSELQKKNELIEKQNETIKEIISQQNSLIAQSNYISNNLLGAGEQGTNSEGTTKKKKFRLFRKKK